MGSKIVTYYKNLFLAFSCQIKSYSIPILVINTRTNKMPVPQVMYIMCTVFTNHLGLLYNNYQFQMSALLDSF